MLPIFTVSRIKISFITFSCISFIYKFLNSEWPIFPFGDMQNLYEQKGSMEKILYTSLSWPIWHTIFVKSAKNYCQVYAWPQIGYSISCCSKLIYAMTESNIVPLKKICSCILVMESRSDTLS